MELKTWYRVKLMILIALLVVIYLIPLDYVEGRSFCFFYNNFDITCLGCGFSRAFFNMTRFNFLKAIDYNSMILFLGPLFISLYFYELIHTIFKILNYKISKKSMFEYILNILKK